MNKFKVGDRVRIINDYGVNISSHPYLKLGNCLKITNISKSYIGFAEDIPLLHTSATNWNINRFIKYNPIKCQDYLKQ